MKKIHGLFLLLCFSEAYATLNQNCFRMKEVLQEQILIRAEVDIVEKPLTISAFVAERSAGTIHDFFSEGDYWWPDTLNPDGPYIRRDGETNPNNFVAHRYAMIRFSMIVGNLTSAYLLTDNKKYVEPIVKHVRAWFIDEATRMNPHLLYAQAIQGVTTGRGVGIIDTIHLIEVVQSLIRLEMQSILSQEDIDKTKEWFREYLNWMSTHPYGISEMNAGNNHGTCWALQAAIFAKYVGDNQMTAICKERFKNILLPKQMKEDGSFPRELERTKPYGYSLFNLDVMAALCHILSSADENMWEYSTLDGKYMRKGIDFMYPYIVEKMNWPYPADVMHGDEWPIAQPALLFVWMQYPEEKYFSTWRSLEHFPTNEEVIRNLPIRNPIIWFYNQ